MGVDQPPINSSRTTSNQNKVIPVMCLAHLRAFIQQTNRHKHKQPRLD